MTYHNNYKYANGNTTKQSEGQIKLLREIAKEINSYGTEYIGQLKIML